MLDLMMWIKHVYAKCINFHNFVCVQNVQLNSDQFSKAGKKTERCHNHIGTSTVWTVHTIIFTIKAVIMFILLLVPIMIRNAIAGTGTGTAITTDKRLWSCTTTAAALQQCS